MSLAEKVLAGIVVLTFVGFLVFVGYDLRHIWRRRGG
jgi:hypothetical protein